MNAVGTELNQWIVLGITFYTNQWGDLIEICQWDSLILEFYIETNWRVHYLDLQELEDSNKMMHTFIVEQIKFSKKLWELWILLIMCMEFLDLNMSFTYQQSQTIILEMMIFGNRQKTN